MVQSGPRRRKGVDEGEEEERERRRTKGKEEEEREVGRKGEWMEGRREVVEMDVKE